MGFKKFNRNNTNNTNKPKNKSRKQQRKDQRKEKKLKKTEYLFKRQKNFGKKKKDLINQYANNESNKVGNNDFRKVEFSKQAKDGKNFGLKKKAPEKQNKKRKPNVSKLSNDIMKERDRELKLKQEMVGQRKKQLIDANLEEEKSIKRLEKQLKLDKRKSKSVPKSFIASGLDYILDVCDSDKIQAAAVTEQNLFDSGSEFEEDFAVVTGQKKLKKKTNMGSKKGKTEESDSDETDNDTEDQSEGEDEDMSNGSLNNMEEENDSDEEENESFGEEEYNSEVEGKDGAFESLDSEGEVQKDMEDSGGKNKKVRFIEDSEKLTKKIKLEKKRTLSETSINSEASDCESFEEEQGREIEKVDVGLNKKNPDGIWEDIYGRKRDKDGNIIQEPKGKYIPPHLRHTLSTDNKKKEELLRLKKEMKGLLNRLAENNMHSISNQIEELYMKNSRHDMNETLISLFMDSLVSEILTPERLIMEHVMLIAILHANVGTEIGAYILQSMVKKFDEILCSSDTHVVENKQLDNLMLIIVHFYTFKIFNSSLIYNLMNSLCDRFGEKEVDLLILVLRSVGFILRKDDPAALKNLLLKVQKLASESQSSKDNSRVRFMLDVLSTIKNNNMSKLPQYDPTHAEHLKKILRTMLRKGNYVTELKISLEDLLKADERGKWWVVGSAWAGTTEKGDSENRGLASVGGKFSQEILDLAKKQRMNTATRRNIFCILMTAEDYLDAFEKLLKLGLKGQPEQEIVHVLIHCLLQENLYNPYYAHIGGQLCRSDRKHQMTIQYSVWDRIKELGNLNPNQITNLAKFLAHLFLDKSLPISVLKVLQFAEMDKPCVRLLRQILLTILTHEEIGEAVAVFTRASRSEHLAMFRESLRLFLHHFILRNTSDATIQERVRLADQALTSDSRNKLI